VSTALPRLWQRDLMALRLLANAVGLDEGRRPKGVLTEGLLRLEAHGLVAKGSRLPPSRRGLPAGRLWRVTDAGRLVLASPNPAAILGTPPAPVREAADANA
jgi:hypothetical protein